MKTGKDFGGHVVEVEYESIGDIGDHMPIEEYIEYIEGGYFIDYDGFGYYATETQVSNFIARPSDLKNGKLRKDFTHIVWYNR